jgi:hypothetical protein
MSLKKIGTPVKMILVEKSSAFALDINMLASLIEKKWTNKKITLNQLHEALKSMGVSNYLSEDMGELVSRLQSIGFEISK